MNVTNRARTTAAVSSDDSVAKVAASLGLGVLLSLSPVLAQAPRDPPQVLASLAPPSDECPDPRSLETLLMIPPTGQAQAAITVHSSESCGAERLVIWKRSGQDQWSPWQTFDEGLADASTFELAGERIVQLSQIFVAAGHSFEGTILLHATDDGNLSVVTFEGECQGALPSLGAEFDPQYGISYSFTQGAYRFSGPTWKPDDGMHSPTGGSVEGEFLLEKHNGSWRLVVGECNFIPTEKW